MLSQLGIEGRLVQYLVALFIVLVLVGLFALVLRRITGGRMGLSTAERGRTRQPRLGIVDVYDLDRQRQLVLLRRDNVEHLLLIGGPNDVVVETNIMRVAAGRQPQAGPEMNAAPQPQAVPERMPTAALEAYAPPAAPERLQPDRPANDGPPRPILEPSVGARMNLPEPQPLSPVPGDPMGDLANRARTLRPEPPMVADAALSYESMPAPPAPPAPRAAPTGATIATPRPPEPRLVEPRPPQPQAGPNEGDSEVMSDMARQLQQALRRPGPPQQPGPAPVEPPAPPARMAPQPAPRQAEPPRTPEAIRPPEPRQAPPAPRPVAPPEPPRAAPPPPPPPPPAAPPPPPPRQAAGSGKVDPFSVDEIEAEFARLLGRSPDKT